MNPTATAKPKAKFSSRNLSAVFKAPLGTKPLPDNATGPLQRPNSRMLVLGRAVVAPPAPLNTPSLKRESQLHDVPVSLVPAGSNWAENAEKQQNPKEDEAPEHLPDSADVAAPTVAPEMVWTSESVAEHLHTSSATARPKVTVESSGRWGDDAVEHDIVQNKIRRQMQKEREFPDLKEAVEETQMYHGYGHAPAAANESLSMGPQQSEQHHGRATGRWAHFNEQEEVHRPMQDDCWSRDRYERNEDDRWSRDHYSRDEDDRWSRGRYSRYDAGYGREGRPDEADSNTVSPVPNDSHTHFSRSDARFDMVVSGDCDRVLSHSPHRMEWGSGPLSRRDGDVSFSPAPPNGPKGSRFHALPPRRSASPPPAPTSSPMAADVAPARAMNWRNLPSPDHGPGHAMETPRRTNTAWSKNEEPSTLLAEAARSSTESSSNSSSSSSSSPPQQVQLLKRPKLLFDPKTGGMVNTEDTSGPAKRQTGGRNGGKDRDKANASIALGLTTAIKRADRKPVAQSKAPTSKTKSVRAGRKEENATAGLIDAASIASQVVTGAITINPGQEAAVKDAARTNEASSPTSSDEAKPMTSNADIKACTQGGISVNRDGKRVTVKRPSQQESGSRVAKPRRASRSTTSQPMQQEQQFRSLHSTVVDARGTSRASSGKATDRVKRSVSTRNDRRDTGGNKPGPNASGRKAAAAEKSKVDPAEIALLKQIAEESNGGVVVLSDEQEGIEVNPEDDGFETVKSRRAVLFEKKLLRQRVVPTEAVAPVSDGKKSVLTSLEEHANEQSKGEEVRENFGMVAKVSIVDAQPSSRPRGKAANSRRNVDQVPEDRKPKRASKQSTPTSGARHKELPTKAKKNPAGASDTESPEQVAVRPTEQVPGEPPAESPLSKKRAVSAKVSPATEAPLNPRKERQGDQARGNSSRKANDRKLSSNAAGATRKQEQSKRRGTERSSRNGVKTEGSADRTAEKVAATKPRAPSGAKARPKQVRQVYVVKTPAPTPASATSTAA